MLNHLGTGLFRFFGMAKNGDGEKRFASREKALAFALLLANEHRERV